LIAIQRRILVDWCLGKVQLVAAGAVVAFGASLKADVTKVESFPVIPEMLRWMQGSAWAVVVVGPFVVGSVQWARRRFGSPWAWEAIQKILDEFRNEVFGELEADPLDHHRVTLFRYRKFSPFISDPRDWCHWLVAVARSDHLTKQRIRRFRAPDDGEQCEGVVGRAWRCSSWVIVTAAVPTLNANASDDEIELYASKTGVDHKWVRRQLQKRRPLAMSYAALLVRLHGKPWGVLVLDSRRSEIDVSKLERFKAYGNLLTPLFERI
jgi:hypothetical protein